MKTIINSELFSYNSTVLKSLILVFCVDKEPIS